MGNFGEILKKIRLEKGLSQEELGKILGTTKQVISRYETNQRTPKITAVEEYAKKLNVPVTELLGKEPEQTLDQKLEGIDFALWGVIQDLSDEAKEDILKYAEFAKMREQQKNNRD